jgi:uncharacterized membrane protein YfcA
MRRLVLLALVGLCAQLVDGSLGMGYGVTSATLLVAAGVGPAAASAAIHFSELGTTLVSGLSHHTLGNTDWRTVGVLALPGFAGAFAGATLLVNLDADVAVPVVASILVVLGTYVTWRFLSPRRLQFGPAPGARLLAPLGLFAGAIDSLGGGGWGPVGTSTLLASGRLEPRKVVGSVDTAEFVVAVGGSLGFLVGLGTQGIQWGYVVALMVGGMVAAPFAAALVRYLPARVLGVAAGGLIVLTNLQTLADWSDATAVTEGLLASIVFTLWVLWTAWAVKLEQPGDPRDPRTATPVGA